MEGSGGGCMNYFDILLAKKTGYIPHNYFDALFAKRIGGAVLKDFPDLPSSIVTVTDAIAKPLDSLKVDIAPVQDLHGYSNPWVGGAGVNKFHFSAARAGYTWGDGCGFSDINIDDSSITFYGTSTATHLFTVPNATTTLKAGSYVLSANVRDKVGIIVQNATTSEDIITSYREKQFTLAEDTTVQFGFVVLVNQTFNNQTIGFQIEQGTTATSYAPYSNICPISGWDEANITVSDGDTATNTYSITFPSEAGTVYGGTLDVTNGTLTVTKANIASYDGETLPGAWISDRDVYSAGGTPTVGAQVVYELAEPITYQLTPTEVQMLLGTNNIWADTGDILEGKYWSKKSSATRAMLNTLRDAGEVTEITPEEPEEPEENDER